MGSVPLLKNATNLDVQRAVVAALDTVGTGIAAAGLVAQLDDVSTATVTENQFAPVRISTRRALLVEGVASGTNLNVAVAAALPTGANVIGAVTQSAGPWTSNLTQVGGAAIALGQAAMAASLPVVIASNQSAVAVSGTVTANIGTSGSLALDATLAKLTIAQSAALGTNTGAMAMGSVTTAAPTYTTGNINPLSLTTTGLLRVDGSAVTQPVSGTVTANQGGAPWSANVTQVAGNSVATSATGVQKVGVVGNTGATVDAAVGAAAAPTNMVATGGLYNNTPPAPATTQSVALQLDQAGNQRVFSGAASAALTGWTSATALNTTQTIFTNSGADSVLVHLTQTSTITGGAITFEVSYDGSTWVTIPASCVVDPSAAGYPTIALPYTLVASTNKPFLIEMNGAQALRIKLSTAITGTATVTPNYTLLNFSPSQTVVPGNVANTTPWLVADQAAASGGASIYNTGLSTAAVIAANIKASAGQVYGMQFFNLNAAAVYVRLYNQTASPASTDGANIVWRGFIPGNTAGAGFTVYTPPGMVFTTGIGIRVTNLIADNDTTVLAANTVTGQVLYK